MMCDSNEMKGVLFDLDGTLLDTYKLLVRSFHHAVQDVLGHDESMERFDATIGRPLAQQMSEYSDDSRVVERLLASYRAYNQLIERESIREFPGIYDALAQLQQAGWLMGVVTSKLHEPASRNLDIFGLNSFFDCIVGADDVRRPKPDAEPIVVGAHALGLQPHECFYVGDSPYDMQAGNAAGSMTVAVAWGQHPMDALREQNPCLECAAPSDLPAVLKGR